MSDVFTGTAAVDYDSTAWNMRAWYALRPNLIFDRFATVSTAPQAHPGTAVEFLFANDLAAATTPLSELTSVDSVGMTDTPLTLTLAEYGNVVKPTRYIQATAYIPFNPIVANIVGFNAGLSIDTIARNALVAGTVVSYTSSTDSSRATIAATDTMSAAYARLANAKLVGKNVSPFASGMFTGIIHPDVALDFRSATDLAGWRAANTYVNTELIANGDMGEFEGIRWIKTSRGPILANAGAGSTVDVYQTLVFGQDALAKGYATGENATGPYPQVRPGPVTDPLYRFAPVGWYWLGVYGIFRDAAVYRLEGASSIGAN